MAQTRKYLVKRRKSHRKKTKRKNHAGRLDVFKNITSPELNPKASPFKPPHYYSSGRLPVFRALTSSLYKHRNAPIFEPQARSLFVRRKRTRRHRR